MTLSDIRTGEAARRDSLCVARTQEGGGHRGPEPSSVGRRGSPAGLEKMRRVDQVASKRSFLMP